MDSFPLALSEPWADALFNDAPVAMVLVAADHRFARCNDAFCLLTGYARAELLSRTWQSITHPDDVAGDMDGAERVRHDREHPAYAAIKRYIRKDGRITWVNLHVRAVFEGEHFVTFFVVALPLDVVSTTNAITPAASSRSFLEWAKHNPKDAIIIALALSLFLGRDTVVELLRLWIK